MKFAFLEFIFVTVGCALAAWYLDMTKEDFQTMLLGAILFNLIVMTNKRE